MTKEYKYFIGICPFCSEKNIFLITEEEIKNDFHFSCEFCLDENTLSSYKLEEIKKIK